MKCPQCGYKFKHDFCPYCNIKSNEVTFASNLKAKKLLQAGLEDEVLYSNKLPMDVNKLKILLLTLFFGYLGIGNFYVGRKKRGLVILVCFIVGFISSYLQLYTFDNIKTLSDIASIGSFFAVIAVFMWFSDFFAVLFNKFDYPIVLATSSEVAVAENDIKEQFKAVVNKNKNQQKKKDLRNKIIPRNNSNTKVNNKKDEDK